MAAGYLILSMVLALTLNHRNGRVRAAGTLIAALGLSMIVASIVLADFDGTFHALPARAAGSAALNPLLLNMQAVLGAMATAFLVWAAWPQFRRSAPARISHFNSKATFGLVSRYAHWITATLIFCLIPMGLFIAVLRDDAPDRASFLATHQTLGLLLIPLVAARLSWLLASPPPSPAADLPPWERRTAQAAHLALYCLILAFPLSGFLMTAYAGDRAEVFGWTLPAPVAPDPRAALRWAKAHDVFLPLAFCAIIFAHIGAVLKHHFWDRRTGDVRRMLT